MILRPLETLGDSLYPERGIMKKKTFRKFKRIELVELIYQLRKENIELQKLNSSLEKQLRKTEKLADAQTNHTIDDLTDRFDALLEELRREQIINPQSDAE